MIHATGKVYDKRGRAHPARLFGYSDYKRGRVVKVLEVYFWEPGEPRPQWHALPATSTARVVLHFKAQRKEAA